MRHAAAVGPATPENEAELDQRLIKAAVAGDGTSYGRLVERYERAVAAMMWHFTRDPLVLQELVQDTFVEAYFSLHRFREGAPFFPWLRTIATRVGYRHWRRLRQRRDRDAVLEDWHRTAGAESSPREVSETAETLYRVLELLDPKDRLVLTLQYFEGCNTKEIAERTGWSTALVKVRAFRARKKLKALLTESEPVDHEHS